MISVLSVRERRGKLQDLHFLFYCNVRRKVVSYRPGAYPIFIAGSYVQQEFHYSGYLSEAALQRRILLPAHSPSGCRKVRSDGQPVAVTIHPTI